MTKNHPWSGVHDDLLAAQRYVYGPSGFACSRPVPEPESAEYAAYGFTLDGRSVRFRVAKTTPTKAGQFVTVWQRSTAGPIRPFDVDDKVDLFVISSRDVGGRDDGRFGQFVFPREVLCRRGIVSRAGTGGKRGFRVYPPWVTPTSRQAAGTQEWQVNHFLRLGEDGTAVDLGRAASLYGA
ncbi:MepB family protein [Streptomyces sp. NPDC004111]|uniref:MepB family protein n=1 Tax=Streptomyces sp. NPDC004111 TaxID=3364690 RepID=UPI003697CF6D